MSLAFLFPYLMLNMFRMLIHPSSGACDLFVELFYGLYYSGTMRVGVTLWFGWGGVVWYPDTGWSTTASACIRIPHHPSQKTTQQLNRKLLRMDVLTSETCWALNKEIKKQVTSSWSLFIQLRKGNWTGHILRRNCLLKHVIQEKIQGSIEVMKR